MKKYLAFVSSLALITIFTLHAESQSPEIAAINLFPGISWQATNGHIYRIDRSITITGEWDTIHWHYSKTNEYKTIFDTSHTDNLYFYRVVMATNSPGGSFNETFEDNSGWYDIPVGIWTAVVASGKWQAGVRGNEIENVYMASNPSRAHSGTRYAGITVPESYYGFIELPSVNNPTSVQWWARSGSTGYGGDVSLFYHDGFAWLFYQSFAVYGLTYSQKVVNVSALGFPNPLQRFGIRMSTTTAIYIDDITVFTLP